MKLHHCMICSCLILICITIWWTNHCLNVQWLTKKFAGIEEKKNLKNQDIKQYLTQRIIQKIFKNQKIHCLEIIETK